MTGFKLRIICFFMAIAVLFSSIGYGIFEHTCNFTKKKTITLVQEDDCCGAESDSGITSFTKASCCSLTKTLTKVNINQASFDISFKFTCPVMQFLQTAFFYDIQQVVPVTLGNLSFANPPPISAKLYLALYQTYLI